MHETRLSLVHGERRQTLSSKERSPRRRSAGDGSLSGIKIRREETRRCDQRTEPRQVNVVTEATIRYQRRLYAMPVVNLSSRGMMVESDLRPRIGARFEVRFADCNETACRVRWVRGGRIGLEFDTQTLLIGANDVRQPIYGGRREGEHPTLGLKGRRAPRQASLLRGQLHWPAGSMPVKVRNISASGAMLQGLEDLEVDCEIVLEIPHAAALPGRVRWCRSKQIGVHFSEPLDLDQLTRSEAAPAESPNYVKPDYLRTEQDPDSPWAARWSKLGPGDL